MSKNIYRNNSRKSTQRRVRQTRRNQNQNTRLRQITRSAPVTRRRGIPVASSFSTSNYATLKSGSSSATLVSKEIFPVSASPTGLSFMIPMTPTKWSGTRTCALSYTYASHRPLACRVYWEPAVSTATPGSVAIGTVFAGARLPNDSDGWNSISRSLASTNGGFISTIWDHHASTIDCGRNLRANQFPLYDIQPDDIPFWICLATSATTGMIGYLVIETKFTLRNPLSGAMAQPVTGAGDLTFTHDAENNTTQMSASTSMFNKILNVGQDYLFTPSRNILNTAGQAIVSILSPFIASVTSSLNDNYTFKVDNNINSQNMLGYVVGLASNF